MMYKKKTLTEIESEARFGFGANWLKFSKLVNEDRIDEAENSLRIMLRVNNLQGKSFLDIGSGSGLFSLAARRLGARVVSFDYDSKSVECTRALKDRYYFGDQEWVILQGSVLDLDFLNNLGKFDYVYAWGVLHHTGDMWLALDNVKANVCDNGQLFLALYNYQPFASRYWLQVKKIYNFYRIGRPIIFIFHLIYPALPSYFLNLLRKNKRPRGMSLIYDLIDWLGGYPFEVSRPEEIVDFYISNGFRVGKIVTVGGRHGCNEYVFTKIAIEAL